MRSDRVEWGPRYIGVYGCEVARSGHGVHVLKGHRKLPIMMPSSKHLVHKVFVLDSNLACLHRNEMRTKVVCKCVVGAAGLTALTSMCS